MQDQENGPPVDLPMAQHDTQRDWTALGMLAEVSRVFTQVERNDDQVQSQPPPPGTLSSASQGGERFDLQPQFSADNQEAQGVGGMYIADILPAVLCVTLTFYRANITTRGRYDC